ncbi:DNA binding domain-containing protein, excisionase family [Chitinophaga jiangningensis]|uniref:DNA binding domain-containing protein, excisionase family n=1 Tax=Chitinophaga jiangningensis TaxID=1419482 RepID=A0A1M7HDW7_9BACT|nr:helix-turn-helix domain-containing protein [Chitinophaga jiangningensis]SHM26533.1 DNA binding domain-containing protein, excisionase family [Chitinophaga jiangningensis]
MNNDLILTALPLDQLRQLIADTLKSELSQLLEQKPNDTKEELITRKEAAKLLGISLPTLLDFTKTGKITGYRIGTRVRYKRRELIESLKQIQAAKSQRRL